MGSAARWRVPDGLTYLDPAGSPGKTSDGTDVVDVGFADPVPPGRVVQRAVFEADDPSYAGPTTMTWHVAAAGVGQPRSPADDLGRGSAADQLTVIVFSRLL
ncbi:hypothetical protein [Streptomyces sp. NPDC059092]|uniref:hypothetical protein n=1 Tax=Streptomyces sp. NPDC059092 TaxID=3346725 RepID=UPI0036826017